MGRQGEFLLKDGRTDGRKEGRKDISPQLQVF